YYYITLLNENYPHPDLPEGAEAGIIKGMYPLKASASNNAGRHVQLMGCGSILLEVIAAARLLEEDFGVSSEIWSVTSLTELRLEGQDVERWNLLNP
ncbi:transketolase-like TK C-terminal-containing protein, partial [Pseudomonas viridiflava]|uniref:transketolase-like TK C-terminal-containing protein n=1 Tax=Pseudomonas viridiflava TaxID=33069 RepID=UPI003C6E95D6